MTQAWRLVIYLILVKDRMISIEIVSAKMKDEKWKMNEGRHEKQTEEATTWLIRANTTKDSTMRKYLDDREDPNLP